MSLLKTTLWLAAALPLVLAAPAPAPQSTPSGTPTTHLVPVTYTVDCGCWNICTLEKLITPNLACGLTCDPEFLCESPAAKRDIFPPGGPMPFNPPDVPFDEPMPFDPSQPDRSPDDLKVKEKRSDDPDSKWPWDTPKGSAPRPLANEAVVETVPKWPPPFVKEDDLEQKNDLVKRGGSVSASATKNCSLGTCQVQVTVTATWTF